MNLQHINWKGLLGSVGGAFVAGFGYAFGNAVNGMSVLSVPQLKAAVAAGISAGVGLAWPVLLGFVFPTFKTKKLAEAV